MVSLKVSDVVCKNQICNERLKKSKDLSFGAAPKLVKPAKVAETAKKSLDELNMFTKFDNWYNKKNEINTVIITAIGTGIIAPIVLALNPISKEDKKTKQYTALRQPLSAGLAVITQVGINTPIPKMMDKLAAKGSLGYYYLPDAEKLKIKITDDIKNSINEKFKTALKDDEFKESIINSHYKNELKEAKLDAIKDVGYLKRFLSPSVRAGIKKQIEEKTKTIKKLTPNQITLKHAVEYTSGNLKTLKSLVGIIASVSVLYPTFTFLNWIYPRFVETFFPQLVKDKPMMPVLTQNDLSLVKTDTRKAGV